jgi:hypothetical protein
VLQDLPPNTRQPSSQRPHNSYEIAEALSQNEESDFEMAHKSSLLESGKGQTLNKNELTAPISKNAVIMKATDTSPRILTPSQRQQKENQKVLKKNSGQSLDKHMRIVVEQK